MVEYDYVRRSSCTFVHIFMIIFVLSVIFSDLRLPQPQTVERANFTVKLFVCFITFNVIMGYTCPVDDEM